MFYGIYSQLLVLGQTPSTQYAISVNSAELLAFVANVFKVYFLLRFSIQYS